MDPGGYRDGQNLYRYYPGPNGYDPLGLETIYKIYKGYIWRVDTDTGIGKTPGNNPKEMRFPGWQVTRRLNEVGHAQMERTVHINRVKSGFVRNWSDVSGNRAFLKTKGKVGYVASDYLGAGVQFAETEGGRMGTAMGKHGSVVGGLTSPEGLQATAYLGIGTVTRAMPASAGGRAAIKSFFAKHAGAATIGGTAGLLQEYVQNKKSGKTGSFESYLRAGTVGATVARLTSFIPLIGPSGSLGQFGLRHTIQGAMQGAAGSFSADAINARRVSVEGMIVSATAGAGGGFFATHWATRSLIPTFVKSGVFSSFLNTSWNAIDPLSSKKK